MKTSRKYGTILLSSAVYVLWFAVFMLIMSLAGCVSTVTPGHVNPGKPSFDQSGNPNQLQEIKAILATNGSPVIASTNGPVVLPPSVAVKTTKPTEATSGLLGFVDGQAVLSPHAIDRYNSLMQEYGASWKPAVKPGDGITPFGENFLMDKQHLFYFATANRWHKEGKELVK